MLVNRSSFASSLSQRGIIIVGGKPSPPSTPASGLNERGIIIVGGKPSHLTAPMPAAVEQQLAALFRSR